MMLFYKEIESAVGKLKLVASSNALVAVLWERERPNRVKLDTARLDPQQPILLETERQLKEYFSGERIQFDLPTGPRTANSKRKRFLPVQPAILRKSNTNCPKLGPSCCSICRCVALES